MNIEIINEQVRLATLDHGEPFTIIGVETLTSVYITIDPAVFCEYNEGDEKRPCVDLETGALIFLTQAILVVRRECKGFI